MLLTNQLKTKSGLKLFIMRKFKNTLFILMLIGPYAFAGSNIDNSNALLLDSEICQNQNTTIQSYIDRLTFDECTITVSIYQDGELVSSATWTDHDGNCKLAKAGVTMMAYAFLNED